MRAALLIGLFAVTPIFLMAFDGRKCIDIEPLSIIPAEARPGATVQITWKTTAYRECGGWVIQRTKDAAGVWHQADRVSAEYKDLVTINGQPQIFQKPYVIPLSIPGPALYEPAVARWRNFIQEWIMPLQWEHPFQIRYTVLLPK